jgi:galactokinase
LEFYLFTNIKTNINVDSTLLLKEFYQLYGNENEVPELYFAPGRVNMIGEHTDYNGGYVLPCAISYGTYLLVRRTDEPLVKFATTNFEFKANVPLTDLHYKQPGKWINYPLAVIDQFVKLNVEIKGLELLYSGNIPNGAGLSSSASIEMVTAVALGSVFNYEMSMVDMAKLSRRAENEFVGMNCGIMDMFAIGMGQKNGALFLNCRTYDYDVIPANVVGYTLVIMNTNKRRGLTDSKYNERVAECQAALTALSVDGKLIDLSDLSLEEFISKQHLIKDEVVRKRAHHVISENARVLAAVEALKNNRITEFGQLMNASHDSLRNDYEVTGFELDTIVNEARKISGVIGARMTGAGFGGCAIALVKSEQVDEFCKVVGKNYEEKTSLKPDFYIAEIGDGARKL